MTNTTSNSTTDKNELSKRMFAIGWRMFRVGDDHIEVHGINAVFTFHKATKTWNGDHPEAYVAIEELFKRFDWSYDYSDDGSVWQRGRDQERAIKAACKKLLTKQQVNMLNRKYNGDEPNGFDIKVWR